MHEHDLDLIAEYVDGASSDAAGIEELISTCSTCAAEYQTQLEIRSLVGSIEVTPLDELERARIRRDVWEAGGFATAGNVSKWWERRSLQLASVAAIVFVGVGLVGVLGQLQSDEATFEAADTADLAEAPLASADREPSLGVSDVEEAAAEMADDAMAGSAPTTVIELGDVDLDTLKLAIDDVLASDGADTAELTPPPVEEDADGGSVSRKECDLPPSIFRLTATIDGRPIEVAVDIFDPDVAAVAVWTDTCEPFDLE